jgi:hypothetical protein
VEVLRSDFDASVSDLLLECQNCMSYFQLKTSASNSKMRTQRVNIALSHKSGGCVVWLICKEDPMDCRMQLQYLFFGDGPEKPLPSLDDFSPGTHTKASASGIKAVLPYFREIPKQYFESIPTITELAKKAILIELDIGLFARIRTAVECLACMDSEIESL